jgi:hypothetical protein
MTPRQHAICAHQVLTPDDCDRYVAQWLAAATARDDSTLAGNQLAALAKRLGIPHCGGCENRQDLLNRLNQWVRGDKPPAAKLRFV